VSRSLCIFCLPVTIRQPRLLLLN